MERLEIIALTTKQNGKLLITFLLDSKQIELEHLEFEKRFGDVAEYEIKERVALNENI